MAAVLCLDFDGTVVKQDIASRILERFADAAWQDLREQRQEGRLTPEQFNAAALDLVDAEAADMAELAVEVAEPRDGLLELLDWTHWNGWMSAILSTGWDLYIDPILDKLGVDRVTRHCGRARFNYRWRLRYLSPRGIEVVDGFALSYVAAYRDQGDFVCYVGSGLDGAEAARLADAVFARDELQATLHESERPLHTFNTFHDVTAILERDAERWLESFSSTTAAEG